MKALSIRAPWWWLILYGGKDIENRDWYTGYRGTVLVHASKWFSAGEIETDFAIVRRTISLPEDMRSVTLREMRELGGHIVGQVDIVGCVKESESQWFSGKFGFALKNPVVFDKPYPIKGALGLFEAATSEG